MKQYARVALILLLMVCTVTTFVVIGREHHSQTSGEDASRDKPAAVMPAEGKAAVKSNGFSLSDEEFALSVGEGYRCGAFLDGAPLDGVNWSSSDERVVTVDRQGKITAVATGEATVKAQYSENMLATVKVGVYRDAPSSASAAIRFLASEGSDAAFSSFAVLARQLRLAKNPAVNSLATLLNGLIQFSEMGAGGSGNPDEVWNTMLTALEESELPDVDPNTLRRASLAAYCQGEKLAGGVTLSFTGDCTFAYFNESDAAHMFPAVYRASGSVTYPFDLTRSVFAADDLTTVNFEGTLTQSRAHKDKTFYFRGEPAYVDILTQSSVEAVTVENNHSGDYFDKGYTETLSHLRDAGIRYTCFDSPASLNINGCRVVMLSLCTVGTGYLPEHREALEEFIRLYRADNTLIVVNLHWGVEGSTLPEAWQVETAHALIDAGADLIIGHHPHVMQGIELYNGHYIVYSLGNFSFGGNSAASSPSTMIFRVSFSQDSEHGWKQRASVVPCYSTSTGSYVNNFQPTPLYGSDGRSVVFRLLSLSSGLPYGVRSMAWNQIP